MNVTYVNFRTRSVVSGPVSVETGASAETVIKTIMDDNAEMVGFLEARFGSNQPKGGVVRRPRIGSAFDSYTDGSIDSAIWRTRGANWNRPMPFPAALDGHEATDADANLIATSPEMLLALQNLVDLVDQTLSTKQLPDDLKKFEKALYVGFRIISKARGEA